MPRRSSSFSGESAGRGVRRGVSYADERRWINFGNVVVVFVSGVATHAKALPVFLEPPN